METDNAGLKGILSLPVSPGAKLSDLTLEDLVKAANAFSRFPVYTSPLVPPDRIGVVSGGQVIVIKGLG